MADKKLADNQKTAADMRKAAKKTGNKTKKPNFFQRIGRFFKECYRELKKVTWPSKSEWISYCVAVLAFTVIIAIVVGLFDFGMSKLLQVIVG